MAEERGKTICFIDESNIYKGQEDAGWKIDWRRLHEHLEKDGPIWQTFFFSSAFDPDTEIENEFYRYLKEDLRWEISLYQLGRRTIRCKQCHNEETVAAEKGVDVGVATRMLMLGMNRAYETAILVAGDRDYLEPVQFLKGQGLRVEVVSWRRSLSNEISDESSAPVLLLDDLKNEIAKREKNPSQ